MADETPVPEGPWKYRVTYQTREGREESFEAVPSHDKPDGDEEAMRKLLLRTHGDLVGVDPATVKVMKKAPANANDMNRFATTVAMAKNSPVRPK